MTTREAIAMILATLLFVGTLGSIGCASGIDGARQGVSASFRVYSSARSALDAYDATKQAQIVASIDPKKASLEQATAARAELLAYAAKHKAAADTLELFYHALAAANDAIDAADKSGQGVTAELTACMSAIYAQALEVKTLLQDLGINIGGVK